MANAGTLLSDLNSKSPVLNSDEDLVQNIMADMNKNRNQVVMPSHGGGGGQMISDPNPNTVYPMTSDPSTATAHIIGNSYPTPSDFADVIHQNPASFQQRRQQTQPILADSGESSDSSFGFLKGGIYRNVVGQVKQPILVALIVFLISMPIVNILIGHYIPYLLRSSGDLTTPGIAFKAVTAGMLFWSVQHILVPLVSI